MRKLLNTLFVTSEAVSYTHLDVYKRQALLDIDVQALKRKLTSPLSMYFYTKMLYSCLVDADFLDTEAFMQTNSQRQSPDIKMEALAQRFDLHITNRGWLSPQRPLEDVYKRQVLTRTNGVTIWTLSRQPARRNCSVGEDASYPQLDGKTPWSFTVA